MFWRFGFHTQSAIDVLLEKEEVTLEELLEEEELIQECKAHNKKLVDFLCRPEILQTLLKYVTEKPSDELDDSVKYKHACLAAEIMGCEVVQICEAILTTENLLDNFWKFVENPEPLNPILGSYFCRVIVVLLLKKTSETLQFLRSKEKALDSILHHIGTAAVIDLVVKLVSTEETKEGEGTLEWLLQQGLVSKLIDKFNPSLAHEVHANASQTLIDLLNVTQTFGTVNPLLEEIKSGAVVNRLLEHLKQTNSANILSAVNASFTVIIEIIQRALGFVQEGEIQDIDFKEEDITELLAAFEPNLSIFHEIMINAKPPGVVQSIYESSPDKPLPLGSLRLKIIELFVIFLHTNNLSINKKILDLNVIPCYIDLFFKYQWNNFLHSLVHDMIVKIFSAEFEQEKDLILTILKDARLTEQIVENAKQNEVEIVEKRAIRRGYMGHLILISNHLVKFSELPDLPAEISKYFEAESWKEYVNTILEDTNQNDNKPLGGHRPSNGERDEMFRNLGLPDDAAADHFPDDDDDDFEMDDEVSEKPGFSSPSSFVDSSFKTHVELDDSDDDEVDVHIENFNQKTNDSDWAHFDDENNEEKEKKGPQEYTELSYD